MALSVAECKPPAEGEGWRAGAAGAVAPGTCLWPWFFCWGCLHKALQQRMSSPPGGWRLSPGRGQGWAASCWGLVLSSQTAVSSHVPPGGPTCVSVASSPHKDAGPTGVGYTRTTSWYLDELSQYHPSQGPAASGLKVEILGGTEMSPNRCPKPGPCPLWEACGVQMAVLLRVGLAA